MDGKQILFRCAFALWLLLFGCSGPSERAEISRLHDFYQTQREEYQRVLTLENQTVIETNAWLQAPREIDPRSETWVQMKKLHVRWAAVHVGYRWIAQNFTRQHYRHPAGRRMQQQILQHLLDRQFRALHFEKLAWRSYRSILLGPLPTAIPPEIGQLQKEMPEHPPAADRISPLLNEIPSTD